MTWFWMNHFSVFQGKAQRARAGRRLRGARDPAACARALPRPARRRRAPSRRCCVYLDNCAGTPLGRINENYARELMELHTLGVDGGYTQADVQELARVLTGLPSCDERRVPAFYPRRHDFGRKTLLGRPIRSSGERELERGARAPRRASVDLALRLAQARDAFRRRRSARRRWSSAWRARFARATATSRRRCARCSSRPSSVPRSAASSRTRCTTWCPRCASPPKTR